jgi:hypothetical protein
MQVIEPHVDAAPVDVVAVEVAAVKPSIEFNGAHELVYWWSPVTHAQALAAEIALQPALATNVTSNLITLNPGYVPS